jgi:hypothetical protein
MDRVERIEPRDELLSLASFLGRSCSIWQSESLDSLVLFSAALRPRKVLVVGLNRSARLSASNLESSPEKLTSSVGTILDGDKPNVGDDKIGLQLIWRPQVDAFRDCIPTACCSMVNMVNPDTSVTRDLQSSSYSTMGKSSGIMWLALELMLRQFVGLEGCEREPDGLRLKSMPQLEHSCCLFLEIVLPSTLDMFARS